MGNTGASEPSTVRSDLASGSGSATEGNDARRRDARVAGRGYGLASSDAALSEGTADVAGVDASEAVGDLGFDGTVANTATGAGSFAACGAGADELASSAWRVGLTSAADSAALCNGGGARARVGLPRAGRGACSAPGLGAGRAPDSPGPTAAGDLLTSNAIPCPFSRA